MPLDDGKKPGAKSICLVTPIGADASTTALAQDIEPERTLAVDTTPRLSLVPPTITGRPRNSGRSRSSTEA